MRDVTTVFVGLDVHKDSIRVVYAAAGSAEPPQFVGPIESRRFDAASTRRARVLSQLRMLL